MIPEEDPHFQKHGRRQSIIVESDSPDPSLLRVINLKPSDDYIQQPWKNGEGTTGQIAIYPPDKDFTKDPFFWRLSINTIYNHQCEFSRFPGYQCSTVILPSSNEEYTQPSVVLAHQEGDTDTNVKSLFPYSWDGNWTTTCKIRQPPVTCLQLIFQPQIGSARINVDKLGSNNMDDEDTGDDYGKKRLLGAFCLVYVVEGYVQVYLDGDRYHENAIGGPHLPQFLEQGQTVLIERDEESSPTTMILRPADNNGIVGIQGIDATVICIQIAEGKHNKWTMDTISKSYKSPEPLENRLENTFQHPTYTAEPDEDLSIGPTTTTTAPVPKYDDHNDLKPSRRRQSMTRRRSLVPYEMASDDYPAPTTLKDDTQVLPSLAERLASASFSTVDEAIRRDSLAMLAHIYDPTQLYKPDSVPAIHVRVDLPHPVVRERLKVEDFEEYSTNTVWIKMVTQGLNEWVRIPVIVLRGSENGPVVGLTAAVHGNELNGVPCIHRVISQIDVKKLKGTLVAIPCVNVVGYLKFQREFADGRDLNRQFPGKEDGFASQVYCFHLMHKLLSQFNYLIDLHTASFGRVNSFYVRADMNDPVAAHMAKLQKSQIILHNSGQDGTMRSAAAAKNIKAITVEIGNPQLFQDQYVQWAYWGVMRVLDHFNMYSLEHIQFAEQADDGPFNTILCSSGFWIYTRTGGVLEVYPGVNTIISKGALIARIKDMFGSLVEEYFAPCTSVVIGRSSNPVAITGDRIIHLGVIKKKGETLAKVAKENY
ncbi:uncharacterized protein BX664DRAFT_336579 [Halteromyces radiatus]|uniref:uncharacterized protein n=1 Tax=Halteromyces radiatus TaxID=101107 RepID=UPI00221EA9FC|nr:uncharacterized protein BX664DRAFT_336579 [Halteromyces radiatus]KAI8086709.1 hypothetical protein BX664DRAFT_336579 [Halteromyces radiatus]